MTRPLLTIGIPTYNRAASVAMSIDSIVSRARLADPADYEILVVDDASTDGNWEAVQALAARNPRIPFRLLRNDPKLAYDENVYRVYAEARGKFLWFISDRFLYNVDVPLVIDVIKRHDDLLAVTFSDLFRRPFPTPEGRALELEHVWDDATLAPLAGKRLDVDGARYVLTTSKVIRDEKVLYGRAASLFDSTPDNIVKVNHSEEWMKTFREFIGSYNQFLAGMLEPFRHEGSVAILQMPSFAQYSARTQSGGNRHDWKAMLDYERIFQRVFDFYPPMSERARAGHRILLDLYLSERSRPHMVVPVTRSTIESYCRDVGYEPPLAFTALVAWSELSLPRSVHRATELAYRRGAQLKSKIPGLSRIR